MTNVKIDGEFNSKEVTEAISNELNELNKVKQENTTENIIHIEDAPITDILNLAQKSELNYKKKQQALAAKKARLRITTDWKKELPDISRVTNDDKDAYI